MKSKYFLLLRVASSAVLVDQLAKRIVAANVDNGETIWLLPRALGIRHTRNAAAAFGWLSDLDPSYRAPVLIVLPLVIFAAVLYAFHKLDESERGLAMGLSLVVAGALSNLFDRAAQGFVVDFLRFGRARLPVYNVADICIFAGLALSFAFCCALAMKSPRAASA